MTDAHNNAAVIYIKFEERLIFLKQMFSCIYWTYYWLIVHRLLQEGCWYIFKVKLYLLQLGRVLGILAFNLQMRGHSANWHVSLLHKHVCAYGCSKHRVRCLGCSHIQGDGGCESFILDYSNKPERKLILTTNSMRESLPAIMRAWSPPLHCNIVVSPWQMFQPLSWFLMAVR